MAISKESNIIVKNMNYTPNSSTIDKANNAVNTDTGTLERVPDSNNSLSMENSSNVLGILRNIEKTQVANKISQTNGLEKLTDIIQSSNFSASNDEPLRNNYPAVTDVTDKLDKIKDELGEEETSDGIREKMLDELYTINKNLEGNNKDVVAGFGTALEENEKFQDLQTKIAEARQKEKDEQNKNTLTKIGGWVNSKSELVADTLKNGLEQTGKIFMSGMGEADQKLYAGLLTTVSAFKAAQEAVTKSADNVKKGWNWISGKSGKEKKEKEAKQLAKYEEELDVMIQQYHATQDLADTLKLDQNTKNSFHDIMLQGVNDIEKDLTDILKVFGQTDTADMTSENLLENLDAVTDLALQDGSIENIRDALNTPIDMPSLDFTNEELENFNPDIIEHWEELTQKLDESDEKLKAYSNTQDESNNKLTEGSSAIGKIGESIGVFSTLVTVFNKLKKGAMAMGVIFGAIGGAFSLIPVLIIAGIIGLIAGIVYYADEISAAWDDMSVYFQEKWAELSASWDAFWDDPLGSLSAAWDSFMNYIMNMWPLSIIGGKSTDDSVKELAQDIDPDGQSKAAAEKRVMEQYEQHQAKKQAREGGGSGSNTTVVDNSTNSNSNVATGGGGNKTHIYSGVPVQGTSQGYTYGFSN